MSLQRTLGIWKRGGDSNGSKNCGLRTYWFGQLENHLNISLISFFPVPWSQTFQFGQMFPNFAINPQNDLRKIVLLLKVCRLPTLNNNTTPTAALFDYRERGVGIPSISSFTYFYHDTFSDISNVFLKDYLLL